MHSEHDGRQGGNKGTGAPGQTMQLPARKPWTAPAVVVLDVTDTEVTKLGSNTDGFGGTFV